jgi:acetyl esterase/lipase
MTRRVKRLLVLVLPAAAAAIVIVRRSRQDQSPASAAGPQWPTFDTAPNGAGSVVQPVVATPQASAAQPVAARWVAPVDGACPDGYPVKANDDSGIFHVPGGRFYERTVPERCYARADDAVADGYRAAKA